MMSSVPADLADLSQYREEKSDVVVAPDTFTLVTADPHTTIRDNSYYKLVEDLQSESLTAVETKESSESVAARLRAYRIESFTDKNGHKAWFIHFDTPPENELFVAEGFVYEKGHLRIDERFANDNTLKAKKGFTAVHETRQYWHPVSLDVRIVHGYIGQNASFRSCQIKEYKHSGDERGEQMEISAPIKVLIQKNSSHALELTKTLLEEKHKRYKSAIDKSCEIETELSDILQKILTNNTGSYDRLQLAAQYQALTLRFAEEIEKINRYNDQTIDKRATQLVDLSPYVNPLRIIVEPTESVETEEEFEESNQASDKSEKPLNALKAKRDKQLKQSKMFLIGEIKKLEAELNPFIGNTAYFQDIRALISLQEIKLKLKPKLVELAFFPGISQSDNDFLKRVTEKADQTLDLFESFKDAVKFGDVERVSQLYPHVQDKNLFPIFFKLITGYLVLSKEERVADFIAIVESFCQSSNFYGEEMLGFSSIVLPIFNDISCSALFIAFSQSNYSAFEFLLNKGFDPNSVGLFWEDGTSVSIMKTIVYFMNKKSTSYTDLRYIKKLLDADACVDLETQKFAMKVNVNEDAESVAKAIQCALQKTKKTNKPLQGVDLLEESEEILKIEDLKAVLKNHASALEIACALNELPGIELLKDLAPHSSLPSLIKAFAFMANRPSVNARWIVDTQKKCFFACQNKKHADETSQKLLPGQNNVSLIVYQTNPQNGAIFVASVNVLVNALSQKYREMVQNNPEEIGLLRDAWLEQAQNRVDLSDRTHLYFSALYLQSLSPISSVDDVQNMAVIFSLLGAEYHIAFADQSVAIYFFKKSLECCEKLGHFEALKTTDFYQNLQKKLVGTAGSLSLPGELKTLIDNLQQLFPGMILEAPTGAQISPMAEMHNQQVLSLSALANGSELKTAPPPASGRKPKKKKK